MPTPHPRTPKILWMLFLRGREHFSKTAMLLDESVIRQRAVAWRLEDLCGLCDVSVK